MPASLAATSRGRPSRALASPSRRALTRPSRSRRAKRRSSAASWSVRIGKGAGTAASPRTMPPQRLKRPIDPSPFRPAGIRHELTLAALDMAIVRQRPAPGLVHHADRGVQYAAHGYRTRLRRHGMGCSMSRKGDCWDSAPRERFFATLKGELGGEADYQTRDEARADLFQYIEGFYNRRRLHSGLGYLTPEQ